MINTLIASGAALGLVLLVFLVLWGVVDLAFYLIGLQTFSQWVIKTAKKHKWFAWVMFLVIVGLATWLVFHFELPRIIWG